MGAVIGMEGSRANRRKMFDLGIAGPLAGWPSPCPSSGSGIFALGQSPGNRLVHDSFCFHNPLADSIHDVLLRPAYPTPSVLFHQPVQSLPDGRLGGNAGHRAEHAADQSTRDGEGTWPTALLGAACPRCLARGLLVVSIALIVIFELYIWLVMLLLVIWFGHRSSADGRRQRQVGLVPTMLGWAAVLIPIFCLPLLGVSQAGR